MVGLVLNKKEIDFLLRDGKFNKQFSHSLHPADYFIFHSTRRGERWVYCKFCPVSHHEAFIASKSISRRRQMALGGRQR